MGNREGREGGFLKETSPDIKCGEKKVIPKIYCGMEIKRRCQDWESERESDSIPPLGADRGPGPPLGP